MTPLISIIVPIYNVEKYLTTCIDSILRQDYNNIEVILVDDGSPDNCPAICDEYLKKDSRIEVIHKKNGGLSDARNAGLAIAKGEYITFIDSDDYVAENYISRLYDALRQKGASIAICGIQLVDENRIVTEQKSVTVGECLEIYSGREIIKRELQGEWLLVTAWGTLYSARTFSKIRFPKARHYEDEFIFASIYSDEEQVACIPENLYFYLQRSDSIMGVRYKKQDCIDYLDMWHDRIRFFEDRGDKEMLPSVIQSCLAWNVLYGAVNALDMGTEEQTLMKADIRKYFWKIFKRPYLHGFGYSVKLAVKCIMTLCGSKSLARRYQ